MRCSAFIATSLDGFIARPDGRIDWLEAANRAAPAGEDCGFAAFLASVDALVMGRATFETVRGFGAWPYGGTPVAVLSGTLGRLPAGTPETVTLHAPDPAAVVRWAEARGYRHLYVDGGTTIRGFMAAGLLTEWTITTVPVLIGEGLPLFGPHPSDIQVQHIETRTWPFGFVQSRYAVGHEGRGGR